MPDDEVSRIQKVYEGYQGQQNWNPENRGHNRIIRERYSALRQELETCLTRPLAECRILDVGCGGGELLGWFHTQGVQSDHLFGIDIRTETLAIARRKHPGFDFREANAERLEYTDASFDIVVAFTLFSSILDAAMATNVANNITRVLRLDGVLLWYDIRYPNPLNPNVMAMTKSRIAKLFPNSEAHLRTLTLLPPITYRMGHFTEKLYPALATIPFLRSHNFGSLKFRAKDNRA